MNNDFFNHAMHFQALRNTIQVFIRGAALPNIFQVEHNQTKPLAVTQKIVERRNLIGWMHLDGFQFLASQFAQRHKRSSGLNHFAVVEQDRHSIFRESDVDFNSVSACRRRQEYGWGSILCGIARQPSVRDDVDILW